MLVPLGERVLLIVRHQPECQRLLMLPRFIQRQIDSFPGVFTPLRLELRPKPAEVCDRRVRKVRLRIAGRQFGRGPMLRPFPARIDRIPVETLEGRNAHSGIYKNFVNLTGTDHHCLGLRPNTDHYHGKQRCWRHETARSRHLDLQDSTRAEKVRNSPFSDGIWVRQIRVRALKIQTGAVTIRFPRDHILGHRC